MTETTMLVLILSGVACWRLGGAGKQPFKKNWRKVVWPLITLVCLHSWIGTLVALTIFATATLPYGEKFTWRGKEYPMPWFLRALVLFSLGLPVFWLDPIFGLWWALGQGIVLIALMILSHRYNRVSHPIWECSAGFLQAAGIILGALR